MDINYRLYKIPIRNTAVGKKIMGTPKSKICFLQIENNQNKQFQHDLPGLARN